MDKQNAPNIDKAILKQLELRKRIEEHERLINLIQNPGIRKEEILPINKVKEFFMAKKIQTYWRKKQKPKIDEKEIIFDEMAKEVIDNKGDISYLKNIKKFTKDTNKYVINIKGVGLIIKIQRNFRRYLNRKNQEYLKSNYTKEYLDELLNPIKYESCIKHRDSIYMKIKTQDDTNLRFHDEREKLIEEYIHSYYYFNEEFPAHIDMRLTNYSLLNQTLEEIGYLSYDQDVSKIENLRKFDKFYFDQTKKNKASADLDKLIKEAERNANRNNIIIDDFAERMLINEIDAMYDFTNFEDLIYN